MKSFFLAAAAGLVVAAIATAQAPPPIAAPLPPPSAVPVLVGGTVVSGPASCSTPALGLCLPGKCAGPACTPEVKPAKKTVYSTVTREYCVPTRSCLDMLLKCCGLSDDCDGPSGETRTKTLLVKKQVPKCEEPCATCKTVIVPAPAASVSVLPVKP